MLDYIRGLGRYGFTRFEMCELWELRPARARTLVRTNLRIRFARLRGPGTFRAVLNIKYQYFRDFPEGTFP